MVFDEHWHNSTFPDHAAFPDNATFPEWNSTVPPNGTFPLWMIPPNPGRSLQPDIVACAVITFLLSTAFVGFRFYTRGYLSRVLGAADWCILPALVCAAGVTASSLEQMVHGAGKHFWEIDHTTTMNFERAAWYGILFYNLSLTFSRISILLLYKRIFTYSWIKRAIQVVLIAVIALGIWFVVSVCTACMPLEAFWNWSLYFTTHVYCQPVNLWWANAGLHIASDLIIMALPMPVLSSLNLPKRQKYAVVGLFALGFSVCIFSIVRLITLINITGQETLDGIYTSAHMIFWTNIEVNAAIVCACLMTLKPLIQRVFPRLLSPSKGLREPSLQWITPVRNDSVCSATDNSSSNHHHTSSNSNNHNRPSPSPTSPLTPISPTYAAGGPRRGSAASLFPVRTRTGSTNGGCCNCGPGGLPYLHEHNYSGSGGFGNGRGPDYDTLEKSRYYHGFTNPVTAGAGGRKMSTGGMGVGGIGGETEYDLDADLDLEAQRTCSECYFDMSSSTIAAGNGVGGTTGGGWEWSYRGDDRIRVAHRRE